MIDCLKDGVVFQIDAFNWSSTLAFPNSVKMNSANRRKAVDFVSRIRAGGGTRPWSGMDKAIQSNDVEQVVLLSDGWTSTYGRCIHTGRYERYSDCYQKFNNDVRNNPNQTFNSTKYDNDVIIDTLSIGNNFCAGNGWLGDLSSKNNGKCSWIK